MAAGEEGCGRGWCWSVSWESKAMSLQDGGGGRSAWMRRESWMCFGVTAAALLPEDLEGSLTHGEKEKYRVDKVTATGNRNEIRGRGSQEQSLWEGTGMRRKSRETSKAEERKKGQREGALGRLGNYNFTSTGSIRKLEGQWWALRKRARGQNRCL